MKFDKKRCYIQGKTLWDYLYNVSDIEILKKELEIFIGFVLDYFKTEKHGILQKHCYDVSLANTIIEKTGEYKFFDFEFLMNDGVPASYLIYRIIRNSFFNECDKQYLYSHLCNQYNLQNTWNYWEVFHDISEEYMLLPPQQK